MTLETALRSYVLADATVAALAGTRMYPRRLPQGPTLPALVYQRVDTRRLHDFDGPDGLPRARVQIAAWASNVAGAWELANAVRAINMLPRLIEATPGALTVLDFPAPVASDGLLLG